MVLESGVGQCWVTVRVCLSLSTGFQRCWWSIGVGRKVDVLVGLWFGGDPGDL